MSLKLTKILHSLDETQTQKFTSAKFTLAEKTVDLSDKSRVSVGGGSFSAKVGGT